MMTFTKITGQAKYNLELTREDYYLNLDEPDGLWCDAGAAVLKLTESAEAQLSESPLKGHEVEGKVTPGQNLNSAKKK